MTAIFRRRSFCCRRCLYAGYSGHAYFDWGSFPLGGVRYKSVEFLTCLRCGVVHASGSHSMQRAKCGPWFAQPGVLQLAKTKATVYRGDAATEEWFDCVSEEAEYLFSSHQPLTASDWHERAKGVWVAGGLPCDRCGTAGELADLILSEDLRCTCPRCSRESLESL